MSHAKTPAWFTHRPTEAEIAGVLARSEGAPFSYPASGVSAAGSLPGFETDLRRISLGAGDRAYAAACAAVGAWRMFPEPWTFIAPERAPQRPGQMVAMCVRFAGGWWVNSCRVVELVGDEGSIRRRGLAYGTLPAHSLQGEARFWVEQHPDGRVEYVLRAVSRLSFPPARWFRVLARGLQLRFVDGSPLAVRRAVGDGLR